MNKASVAVIGVMLLGLTSQAGTSVKDTRSFTDPKLGLTAVAGTLELPAGAGWAAVEPAKDSGLSQLQLMLAPEARELALGNRARKIDLQDRNEQERNALWRLYWACNEYAKTNNGAGPASWEDIRTNASPQISQHYAQLPATNFFLIPSVPLSQRVPGKPLPERQLLALQLNPRVADGQHWVLYSDGQPARVAIDKAVCDKYNITVTPQQAPGSEQPQPAPATWSHHVFALAKPDAGSRPVPLLFTNRLTGTHLTCEWACGTAAAGGREVLSKWATARALSWSRYVAGDAPVLSYWLSRGQALYGADSFWPGRDRAGGRLENTDTYGVLGGRAAIRETLQMQPLQATVAAKEEPGVAVATLAGVEVKSHPFDQMLKGVKPGTLALADSVPADRAFVYFPKPATLLPLLNGGSDFIFAGGSL
ncbi:MAG: hypothetical protein WCK89_03170, partial [bacterium]